MFHIRTYNSIAESGLQVLRNEHYQINHSDTPEGIMLRSYPLKTIEIPSSVIAVSRAGVGVNNIPLQELSQQGIVVFNTPGANANAVKELVLMSLIATSRDIFRAVNWTTQLQGRDIEQTVESGKKGFVGSEISGKRLGVIGVGSIGALVANDALSLGMDVIAFDPFISVNTAWKLSRDVKRAHNIEEIFQTSDYITLHVPYTDETKEMIHEKSFSRMKNGVKLLNFSRGELVNEQDLEVAIQQGKVAAYMTDFPNKRVLALQNVVAIPHLGASTTESEENCSYMAAKQLVQFLQTGNIQHSVNLPDVHLPYSGVNHRITVFHQNIPNMVGQITSILARFSINIADMLNRSKGDWAYSLMDLDHDVDNIEQVIQELVNVEGVRRVRII
ncbi:phosphoglycerate dehydrogenase [Bacillus sp. BGMRC 2118]|nr:phosphoglycerate dehydrogenase [Bacillus sp. BGMRC 2118]